MEPSRSKIGYREALARVSNVSPGSMIPMMEAVVGIPWQSRLLGGVLREDIEHLGVRVGKLDGEPWPAVYVRIARAGKDPVSFALFCAPDGHWQCRLVRVVPERPTIG
jgi:hypothetical protein